MSADNIDTLKRFSVEACRNKFTVGIASKPVIKNYKVSLPIMGGSNRTTTDFDVGQLLPSATESSGTSTLHSG